MKLRLSVVEKCFHPGPVCVMSAGLRKNYRGDFHDTWWKDGKWAKKEPVDFWCGSGPRDGSRNLFFFSFNIARQQPELRQPKEVV